MCNYVLLLLLFSSSLQFDTINCTHKQLKIELHLCFQEFYFNVSSIRPFPTSRRHVPNHFLDRNPTIILCWEMGRCKRVNLIKQKWSEKTTTRSLAELGDSAAPKVVGSMKCLLSSMPNVPSTRKESLHN